MQHSRDVLDAEREIVVLKDEYHSGYTDPLHSHEVVQILFAINGVMSVRTPDLAVVIPPQRAVIIPAGTDHEVSCRGPVSLRTIYAKSGKLSEIEQCRVIEVSELIKALIVTIADLEPLAAATQREEMIVSLLIEEILDMPTAPFSVVMPKDPRLQRVCRQILDDPSDNQSIDQWAKIAAMARRTFTRAFRRETGVTFAVWRQQVRLLAALSLLSEGQSITMTAYEVGYESSSGFGTMFRRAFGVPPSQYLK